MHIFCTFKQLLHIEFDLAGLEFDTIVFQKPCKIVVHVGKDHVHGKWDAFVFACVASSTTAFRKTNKS
jgi:hypothetical protein